MWLRHVLVPLDASSDDRRALDAATAMAIATGANVTLLLLRTPAVSLRLSAFAAGEELSLPDAGVAYVERSADLLRDWDVEVDTLTSASDDPVADIDQVARGRDVSAVLLLTHRQPPRRRWRLRRPGSGRGSIASRLVRRSSVPVLTVPPATIASTGRPSARVG